MYTDWLLAMQERGVAGPPSHARIQQAVPVSSLSLWVFHRCGVDHSSPHPPGPRGRLGPIFSSQWSVSMHSLRPEFWNHTAAAGAHVNTLSCHQGGLKGGLFCAVPVCQLVLSVAIKVGWRVVCFVLYLYVSTLWPSRWVEGWSILFCTCLSTNSTAIKVGWRVVCLCCTCLSVHFEAIKVGWRVVCFVLYLYVSTLWGHQGGLKGGLFCAVPVCQYSLWPSRWVEGWSVLCCTYMSVHFEAIKVGWRVVCFVLYLSVNTLWPSRWVEGWSVLCCTCLSIHCGHQSGLKGGLFCAVPVCQYTVAIKVGWRVVCFVLYLSVNTLWPSRWVEGWSVLYLYVSTLCGHQDGLKGGLFCAVPVCRYSLWPSRWVEGWSVLCCTCMSVLSVAIKVGWRVVCFVLYLYVGTLCGHQGGLKGGLFCAVHESRQHHCLV